MSQAGDYIDILGLNNATAGVDSGAAAAGAAVYGSEIDLRPSSGYRYRRLKAFGGARTYHKTATQSMSYALGMQHRQTQSGTGSTWAKYATASDPTAKTVTATASGTTNGRVVGHWDMRSSNRYARVKLTPTSSTTATGMIYHFVAGAAFPDICSLPTTG
jgi:hypothetical protein